MPATRHRHVPRLRSAPWLLALGLLASPIASRAQADPGDTSAPTLLAGEYRWYPERSAQGDVVVSVSLPEQRLRVYRAAVEIGESTVSTGRSGYETPTGQYRILQKRARHFSNKYDNAPMPHMQRLTWDGIALHGGHVPGRPASHGCVRLPPEFAKLLFQVTALGTTVVILDGIADGAIDAAGEGAREPTAVASPVATGSTTEPVADPIGPRPAVPSLRWAGISDPITIAMPSADDAPLQAAPLTAPAPLVLRPAERMPPAPPPKPAAAPIP